jgi:hypothetical protein
MIFDLKNKKIFGATVFCAIKFILFQLILLTMDFLPVGVVLQQMQHKRSDDFSPIVQTSLHDFITGAACKNNVPNVQQTE